MCTASLIATSSSSLTEKENNRRQTINRATIKHMQVLKQRNLLSFLPCVKHKEFQEWLIVLVKSDLSTALTGEDNGIDFIIFPQDPNDQTAQVLRINTLWESFLYLILQSHTISHFLYTFGKPTEQIIPYQGVDELSSRISRAPYFESSSLLYKS